MRVAKLPLMAIVMALASAASPAFAADDNAAIQARLSRLEAQNAALLDYIRTHSNDPAAAKLAAQAEGNSAPAPEAAPPSPAPAPAPAPASEYTPAHSDGAMDLVGVSSDYSAKMLDHNQWTNTKNLVLLQAQQNGDLAHHLTIGGDVIALADWQFSNTAAKFGWLMRQPTANNQVGHHVSELAINSVQMNLTARANSFITAYAELLYNPETSFGTGSNTALTRNLVSVTRDDLVGQYIGHTAPKTKEVLKKAMGGVLFIDEAYYLYRPENERDYGQEAIEILLQVMENNRDDIVVILAGYSDRMDTFFASNPGFRSRIAHHINFPDYGDAELGEIADKLLAAQNYRFDDEARTVMARYVSARRQQPHFANARSIRNALDRARLRQAARLFGEANGIVTAEELSTIRAADLAGSRVLTGNGEIA